MAKRLIRCIRTQIINFQFCIVLERNWHRHTILHWKKSAWICIRSRFGVITCSFYAASMQPAVLQKTRKSRPFGRYVLLFVLFMPASVPNTMPINSSDNFRYTKKPSSPRLLAWRFCGKNTFNSSKISIRLYRKKWAWSDHVIIWTLDGWPKKWSLSPKVWIEICRLYRRRWRERNWNRYFHTLSSGSGHLLSHVWRFLLSLQMSLLGGPVEEIHCVRKVESTAQRRYGAGNTPCDVRHWAMSAGAYASSGCVASGRPISGSKFQIVDRKRRAYK